MKSLANWQKIYVIEMVDSTHLILRKKLVFGKIEKKSVHKFS